MKYNLSKELINKTKAVLRIRCAWMSRVRADQSRQNRPQRLANYPTHFERPDPSRAPRRVPSQFDRTDTNNMVMWQGAPNRIPHYPAADPYGAFHRGVQQSRSLRTSDQRQGYLNQNLRAPPPVRPQVESEYIEPNANIDDLAKIIQQELGRMFNSDVVQGEENDFKSNATKTTD